MIGFVKLHRKLLESIVFGNEKCLKIWIWCLLRANHSNNIFLLGRQKVSVKKGEFIMGLNKATEDLELAKSTIHYWLRFLEAEGMVELKKTNKYTVVKLKNWDKYQAVELNSYRKKNSKRTLKETNKNDKNDKNDNPVEQSSTVGSSVSLEEKKNGSIAPFCSAEYIASLRKSPQPHIKIVGWYMKAKGMDKSGLFPTKKACEQEMRRNLKPAKELADGEYPLERIRETAVKLVQKKLSWTLETINKNINKTDL